MEGALREFGKQVVSGYYVAERDDNLHNNVFRHTYIVKKENVKYATILCAPYSSVLNKSLCLVKLHNRVLYCNNTIKYLVDILKAFNIVYKGITRLDLAYDCNRFVDGRLPEKFIKDFVRYDDNEPEHIHRVSSRGFVLNVNQQLGRRNMYNSIRFTVGGNSRVKTYMYDKTLELSQVKDKPWIRKVWSAAGLLSNPAGGSSRHVWRTEISIGSEGCKVLSKKTGEICTLTLSSLDSVDKIKRIFMVYAAKYLDFRRKGDATRIEEYQRIRLFEDMPAVMDARPYYPCNDLPTGRSEKMVVNKLIDISLNYSGQAWDYREAIDKTVSFLLDIQGFKETHRAYLERSRMLLALQQRKGAWVEGLWQDSNIMSICGKVWEETACAVACNSMPWDGDFYASAPGIREMALAALDDIYRTAGLPAMPQR